MAKEKNIKKANSRGITLVALVVTIVVLLILAGITITALFSENGIIKKAQEAKNATEQDQTNTQEGLANLADQMAVQLGEDVSSLGKLIKAGDFVTEEQGHQKVTDKNGKTMYVPVGYKVTSDCNEIDKGVVIEDKDKNQFVWVPVPDVILDETKTVQSGTYTPMAKLQEGSSENYMGMLYTFSKTNGGTATYQTGYTPGTTSYREPDVVTQQYNSSTSSWENGGDVNHPEVLESKYSTFKDQLQAEFNSMVASVDKYKGFYIGRYETGNISSSDASNTPVVQKGNTRLGGLNWYQQYKNSKTIKGENRNVTTSMIWGCQWDATLRWFQTSTDTEVKKFVTDSTGKGNYAGTNGNAPIATGSNDDYKVNNIYDMAGNVWDWTLEAYGTGARVRRGGNCYDGSGTSNPASDRYSSDPTFAYSLHGSRSTLLLNP